MDKSTVEPAQALNEGKLFEAVRLLAMTVNDLAIAVALHEERIAKLEGGDHE